jgi:hypothetical protein
MRRSGEGGQAASGAWGVDPLASPTAGTPTGRPASGPRGERPTPARPTAARPSAEQVVGQAAFSRYQASLARLRPRDQLAIRARIELRQPYGTLAESLGVASAAAARAVVTRALVRLVEEMSS